MVNGVFSAYVLLTGGFFWPVFPIIFWGAGLTVHYIGVFGERKRVSKEMKTLRKPKIRK
ncbi:2TM domain-containing protein [Candidatus Aerophobetes bacterium]|nr:2TM domain-containing protein [Candidatus Aerophobetes bacterium]